MPWKNGTSTQQIKMKQVLDCDLEIVGWYPGKKESAFKDGIGGFDFNQYTGKIAAIEYNELIDSKGKDTWSLFLPIIVEVWEDKTEADSLDKIKSVQ